MKPAYIWGPTDIVTADKLNLTGTPIVELSIQDRVDDQSFLRNGNFYSSFWTAPAGMDCPVGVETVNADYWSVNPNGADVQCLRSSAVPDLYSLFSMEIQGNAGTTDVAVSQIINGDLSSTLRRVVTFSGYIYNGANLSISPLLEIWTNTTFNNFNTLALVATEDLQTCAVGLWTFVSVSFDMTTLTNVANGMRVTVRIPSGALNATTNMVAFSRLKFQIGEIATEFVDDVGLFVQTPSVDSTMLQDGCIARPSLFLPNVIPAGAFQSKAIANGDISDGAVDGRVLAAGATVANLGFTPINKAGDSLVGPGPIGFANEVVVGSAAYTTAAIIIEGTTANASNDGYMPAISFWRQGLLARAIGLDINCRFKTVDQLGNIGWLLDTITGVPTSAIQNQAVTIPKLGPDVVAMVAPPGMTSMFSGPSPPGGWFVADGSAISRTTFAALFAAIGTYWGAGDNVSTFNLPNFVNRVPVGYGSGASWGFGSYGGEVNHQLSIAEMPGHDHGYSQTPHDHGTHSHTVGGVTGAGNSWPAGNAWQIGTVTTSSSSVPASYANISFTGQGGWQAHNNMQPYGVLYFIVKA